jgi:catechol 2,3-dioxygenase-like lactoylglutathione lyase family enzyme
MKRLHVHLHVNDLAQSVRFYKALFDSEPAKLERDYAKWMLDDPRVNFAISTGADAGLSHLGIQVDDAAELAVATERAADAAGSVREEKQANCCYAVGDKAWATDPQGVRWEMFHTTNDLPVFAESAPKTGAPTACCAIGPG